MRLSVRFILPLLLILGTIAYALIPVVDQLTLKWFARDIDIRTRLITNAVQDPLVALIHEDANRQKILKWFNRVTLDERLYAMGFCNLADRMVYRTETLPESIQCAELRRDLAGASSMVMNFKQGPLHVALHTVYDESVHVGALLMVHDLSFIERRSADTKKYIFYLFVGIGLVTSLVTVLIAQLSWKGWVKGMQSLLRGEGLLRPIAEIESPELRPIVKDLRMLIRDIESDRRARDEAQVGWNPKALKELLHSQLSGDQVLIVSNREPYIHRRTEEGIEVQFPASGLVTALEPVMRACSGTWIAHGSGNADREVVDKHDRVRVPPGNPSYQIRRVWLSKEEEQGYYYGFANEGLWPLCHIAHARPVFRSEDWKQYVLVNQKFAQAVFDEAKTEDPVVLVQDYHFALLPKLIKEKLPKATVITFWHIPWPNPEAFGICPWREELLEGMLGSTILGFHTRFHCNNFIDTMDRFLECRIDRETSTISYEKKLTAVRHYPISIEWPVRWAEQVPPVTECREKVRRINSLPAERVLGIGVDRLDYTKGILERFMAVERLLELHPKWRGRFTFVQIAAPSRSSIDQYQHLDSDVRAMASRINKRFSSDGYEPILLKIEHHDPVEVFEYFRAAEVCFVSSLHDGMNLVAKEFVAAREDERGVLVLSQFTGASRELPEALIVNPYDIEQCAGALAQALEMPPVEQRERMRSMRGLVQEFNVYRWAGKMLIDAARIRQAERLSGRFKGLGIRR